MKNRLLRIGLACAIVVLDLWTAPCLHAQVLPAGQFVEAPCPMPVPEGFIEGKDIVCGYATVPEDHAAPAGKSIQLAIAILYSAGANPAPDPLIMVQGGPGTSALSTFVPLMASQFGRPFLEQCDVILLEQRGTYYSQPNLFCSAEETLLACRDRLIAEDVDLQAYTIDNNAADVVMVMEALGYDQYNLYGVSFGTLLAQTVMRDHPERLRSVIMDSVLPATLDVSTHGDSSTLSVSSRLLALHQLFADCAADPTCGRFYPDLEDTTYDTITRLNTEPAVLSFEHPETGEPFEVTLSGDRLLGMIRQALYGGMGPQIPILLDLVAAGEYDLVFSADMFLEGDGVSTWSAGLHHTMNCSALPELVAADLDVQGLDALIVQSHNETFEEFNTACAEWGIENPDYSVIPPAISDIPTLLLSGGLDPNTPPRNAEIVAENLENGTAVVFPGVGHEVIYRHACPRSIALAFLEDPSAPPDTTCADEMVSRFASEPITVRLLALQKDPPFLRLILLVSSLLLLLSGVVAWLIATVRGRGRRGEQANRTTRAHWATGAAAALNIAFVVVFVASNPTEVVYGYPIALRLGMLLPLVSIIPAVVGLIYSLLAWRDGTWRVTKRVHYTLVVLGTFVFVRQLDYWHLLGWRL